MIATASPLFPIQIAPILATLIRNFSSIKSPFLMFERADLITPRPQITNEAKYRIMYSVL